MTDNNGGDVQTRWDAERYDSDHEFVYEYGSDILNQFEPAYDDRVLDLGCGTGHLTNEMEANGANVLGIDRSAEMINRAKANHPDGNFLIADAGHLPFRQVFDIVFSNAVLHWIEQTEQKSTLASIYSSLKPGGQFVAELGGSGNIEQIRNVVMNELSIRGYDHGPTWYFPSISEYTTLLEKNGFEVRYAVLFDRPTELNGTDGLRSWLKMFGDALFGSVTGDEREDIIAEIEDRLRPDCFREDVWTIGYRRLRFRAVRLP